MADYDSNLIKPVDSLKNISGMDPVKHREERKRRQQLNHGNEEEGETKQGQDSSSKEQTGNKIDINSDGIGIDYCA
jgi:hypothetical protein